MNILTSQASCLRAAVKLLLPSAECKNMSGSDYCTLSIQEYDVTQEDGTRRTRQVLYCETMHPCFSMGLQLELLEAEIEVKGLAVEVRTRDLDAALAAFGLDKVTMELVDGRGLVLASVMGKDENGQELPPSRRVCVEGKRAETAELPDRLTGDYGVLKGGSELVQGLRTCMGVSAMRGNGPGRSGVQLDVMRDGLAMHGQNPSMEAISHYEDVWEVVPEKPFTVTLSPDSIRHLTAALLAVDPGQTVALAMDGDQLVVETDKLCMRMDGQ